MASKTITEALKLAAWVGVFLLAFNWQSVAESLRGPIDYAADRAGPVTLYGTEWCSYCTRTSRFLRAQNIPFVELDIEKSVEASAEFYRLGGRGVPVVTVGEQVVHGYSLRRLRAALECHDCPE